MSGSAISLSGLRKSYGDHVVLDDVDLDVETGEVLALLGPNGAGKTTMVDILTTLVRPDGGRASVAGHDVVRDAGAVRAVIGLTGQFSAVDNLLTGAENLRLMADLRHLGRLERRSVAADLLERFDLVEAADRPASTYSGGMRRRLDLAMTLIGRPRVLFLDEPTTGLDPRSRRAVWDIVRELVTDGLTVFLTTQYLEEADQLADRVAVLDDGKLVAEGTPASLKRRVGGGHLRLEFSGPAAVEAALRVLPSAIRDADDHAVDVPHDGSVEALHGLLDELRQRSVAVSGLSIVSADLDDVFLALTGHPHAKAGTQS